MGDFIMAALPLTVVGIALAVFFAGRSRGKKQKETKGDHGAMGMSLGMCFGAAIGAIFPQYIGITLSVGMLIGLVIGMCFGKNE